MKFISDILILFGSLGIFLFGMKLMSEALQKMAGQRLRNAISRVTSNKISSVSAGLAITGLIQSSSATGVMVISFVNAGLIPVFNAIGIILGANIGTTFTAWIINYLGIKFPISMFSVAMVTVALPLLFSKKSNNKSIGEFIIGFAILFIGLDYIKASLPNINENQYVLDLISSFSSSGYLSYFYMIFIGFVITAIIQSSSATMALTLLMCNMGYLSFDMAAALILGENIGTTLTANIAAIMTNKYGRIVARSHFVLNFIGVFWMMLIFPLFLSFIDSIVFYFRGVSAFKDNIAAGDGLTIFHTVFNIINVSLFIFFIPFLEKISEKLVFKNEKGNSKLQILQQGIVSTSEITTVQAKKEIFKYAKKINSMLNLIPELLVNKDTEEYNNLLNKLNNLEREIDLSEVEIGAFLTKISESNLSPSGAEKIRIMMDIIDNIESIGDSCYQLGIVIDNKNNNKIWFTQDIRNNLNQMFSLIRKAYEEMLYNLEVPYEKVNPERAKAIETDINNLRDKLRSQHIENMDETNFPLKSALVFNQMVSLNEKIGDYIINVTYAITQQKYKSK